MDELISRRAAIDALARMMPRSYTPDGSHPADEEIFRAQEVFADCIEVLEILPSAQPEPRWIPVGERLPIEEFEEGRKNGTVYELYPCLVTRYATHTDEPRTRTYVCRSYFDGEDFMLHGGYAPDERSDTENTLAWMPIPESYRGGEE